MLSLANARSEEELRAWVARMRAHLAREGIEDPDFALRRRAEDRRPGDLAASTATACSSAAPRAATARSARTSPTTCARSARSRCGSRRAAAARGPRRGLHVAARLRGAQRAPRRGRAVDVHEPAQLAPRARSASSIPRSPPSGRCRMWCYGLGVTEGLALGSHWEALEWLREHGFRVNGDVAPLDSEDEVVAAVPGLAGAPRRARLRDRRRGGQGRRRRAAAAARGRRARPALGDRVEVPADHRRHDAARGALERRQVRRPAPVRAARARPRRRRDGQDGDAAQRGGPRAQGRPRPATR